MFSGNICTDLNETTYIRKCSELEQSIKANSKLKTFYVHCDNLSTYELPKPLVASVINGVAQNKTITSFTLELHNLYPDHHALTDGVIENLLRDNNTLQALSINIPNRYIPLPVNKLKVKSKLTSLEIEYGSNILMNLLLPCIEGLKCLILSMPYPPCLIFDFYPHLQQLTIKLDTAESINELFTILQTNTSLKALRVEVEEGSVYTVCSIGKHESSFNAKKCMSSSSYMSIITTGIMHNTGLQQLSIPVFLPITNEQMRRFLNVISQTDNITELKVVFQLDQTLSFSNDEKGIMKTFFYEQILPDIFDMLRSHATIKTMSIVCNYLYESSDTNTTAIEDFFHRTPFPSLQQLEIKRTGDISMIKTFKKNVVVYPYGYPITREIKMYIH
uniref:Uncharacterized protein n=1 Tax=Amphimedon queenslandica TaxID=400682 RepID=A0A1X7VPV0_AMPQE